jgi:hypothetical protein
VTCGMGRRERHRFYSDKRPHLGTCDDVLREEDVCYGGQKVCR